MGGSGKGKPRLKKLFLPGTFFICLLLAALFWLLISMAKEYSLIFPIRVSYKENPVFNRGIKLPEKINVSLSGSGFSLLGLSLRNQFKGMELELDSFPRTKFIYFVPVEKQIRKHLNRKFPTIDASSFEPDTIYPDLESSPGKLVNVISDVQLSYVDGMDTLGPVRVVPSQILIYGEENVLRSVSSIHAESFIRKEVRESIDEEVKLILPIGIYANPDRVRIQVPLAQFTEKTKTIDLTEQNIPIGFRVLFNPSKVKISYLVAMSEFEKKEEFKVVCNLINTNGKNSGRIFPELITISNGVRNARISPSSVEYILVEK